MSGMKKEYFQARIDEGIQLSPVDLSESGELEQICLNAPIGFALIDRSFRFIRINKVLAEVSGISISEHIGRLAKDIVPQIWAKVESDIRKVMDTGQSIPEMEVSGRAHPEQTSEKHWLVSYYPVRSNDNQVSGVGIIIQDITEQKKARAEIEKLLDFQTFLAKVSSKFINLPTAEVDNEIRRTLAQVVEYFDVERATVILRSRNKAKLSVTHSWAVDWLEPAPRLVIDDNNFPWSIRKYYNGEHIAFSHPDELPEEAAIDRQTFIGLGVKSYIAAPMIAGGRFIGSLSMGTLSKHKKWSSDIIGSLRLIAEILANAIKRKREEKKLLEAESRYRMIADFTYDWEYCEHPDGCLCYVSPSCKRITGYTPREFIDDPELLWKIILPEDKEAWIEHHRGAHEIHVRREIQFRIHRRDGEIRWIEHACQPVTDSEGSFQGFRASNRDITERKKVEKALRLEEQKLAEAQRIAHLGSWDLNIISNNLSWSDEVYCIFGLQPQEFGATYEAFLSSVHPGDREAVMTAVERTLADPEYFYGVEHRVVRPNGTERIVYERGEVIFDDAGKPVRMIGTVHDITEFRQAENKARHLQEELTHSTRLATLGELTAAITHELNQPLCAIMSNARAAQRLMTQGRLEPDELDEILADITSDCSRADNVIGRLRDLLRKEGANFKPVDLAEIVREIIQLLRSDFIIRNIAVNNELASNLPHVMGDRIQLQQVIMNLILNGVQSMKETPPEERVLTVRAVPHMGDTIQVNIDDNGTGIRDEDLEKIFAPFFTTRPDGLGMGLAISRSIIKAHGGRLWAENNPLLGATFHINLPVSKKC